jgi:hypothetical protein
MSDQNGDGTARVRDAAIELYQLPPSAFIAARNARAKGGDKTFAAAVRPLIKPSPAAWLAGQLSRQYENEFEQAISTGTELRDAQGADDRSRITELDKQRRALVTELVDRARAIASDAGVKPSATVMNEVAQTINAALADDDAAAAVRSGLLVRALQSTGLEPVDLDRALALETVPSRTPRSRAQSRTASASAARPTKAELARAAKQKADEKKRQEEARRARRDLEKKRHDAAERVSHLSDELDELKAAQTATANELASVRQLLAELDRRLKT